MKRIIPFLMLAVPTALVLWGCERGNPAGDVAGPLLKPEKCEPWPECRDGGNGDGGQYTTIDLRSIRHRKSDKSDDIAYDVSEPDGGVLRVVGWLDLPLGGGDFAVVWTGTLNDIGDVEPVHLLTEDRNLGRALGINDAGDIIVGREDGTIFPPVAWLRSGSDWSMGHRLDLGTYVIGRARDVNNDGKIVGTVEGGGYTAAAVWSSPTAELGLLPTPTGFVSAARGLNNQGWVVGVVRDPNVERSTRAVLWGPTGEYCDLHPDGQAESYVYRVDDVLMVGGAPTVLAAGITLPEMRPTIWTVDLTNCEFTLEVVDIWAGVARDVRSLGSGWEAVGADDTNHGGQAALWTSAGESELLTDREGRAFVVNGEGDIAGYRVDKGLRRAVLWVPTTAP
jgi:hypothetical protein